LKKLKISKQVGIGQHTKIKETSLKILQKNDQAVKSKGNKVGRLLAKIRHTLIPAFG